MSATYITLDDQKLWYDSSVYRPLRKDETTYRPGDCRAVLWEEDLRHFIPIPAYRIGKQISAWDRARTIRLISPCDSRPANGNGRAFWTLFAISMVIWAIIVFIIDWFFSL